MTLRKTIPQPLVSSTLPVAERARMVDCGQCWVPPGGPCCLILGMRDGTEWPADHLARYQRAERRGLISRQELAAVMAGLLVPSAGVAAGHVMVQERAA
jgi:hypothetical protein